MKACLECIFLNNFVTLAISYNGNNIKFHGKKRNSLRTWEKNTLVSEVEYPKFLEFRE